MPIFYFLIFCLISIAVLYAEAGGIKTMIYVTKPMIMLWLIFYFLRSAKKKGNGFLYFLFGFIAALLGDIMLMFSDQNENFFLFGLGFFLITHLLYIAAMLWKSSLSSGSWRIGGTALIIGYGVMLVYNLWGGLGEMVLPVTTYAAAISVMAIVSILRSDKKAPYLLLLLGASFFLLSDSMIAINKFSHSIGHARLLIMFTYIVAQFYIVNGAVYSLKMRDGELAA